MSIYIIRHSKTYAVSSAARSVKEAERYSSAEPRFRFLNAPKFVGRSIDSFFVSISYGKKRKALA